MGTCVTTIEDVSIIQGGKAIVSGSFSLSSSYATSGETLNLSNSIKDSSSPKVVFTSSGGYSLKHNQGNAAAGKVLAYFSVQNAANVADQNSALIEVTNATDLSAVNVDFIAYGQTY